MTMRALSDATDESDRLYDCNVAAAAKQTGKDTEQDDKDETSNRKRKRDPKAKAQPKRQGGSKKGKKGKDKKREGELRVSWALVLQFCVAGGCSYSPHSNWPLPSC